MAASTSIMNSRSVMDRSVETDRRRGGGFLMFYTEEKTRLRRAMYDAGLRDVRFHFDFEGTPVLTQSLGRPSSRVVKSPAVPAARISTGGTTATCPGDGSTDIWPSFRKSNHASAGRSWLADATLQFVFFVL
jgi:hypothetical protein